MAPLLYCRKCGTRLPAESPFCPACGASQQINDHTPTNLSSPDLSDKGTGRLPPGRMLRQRYRLLQAVGQGGMGAVYVAQDAQLGDRLVAVKEMSMSRLAPQELPRAIEQFQREAHLLASLHHANLPTIYDYFEESNRWYLVMSFIEGGTLQTSLDTTPNKRLPINEVIRIGIELCNVLDYLHTHQPQVIFRDLKPANIMLTPKGQIYLIDFGIARHFKQEQAQDTAFYYSVGYAPPEQYGQSQTSPRSDIYSLGATLHQMLSGHSPANRPFQFPALHFVDPTIPPSLATLIAQMLEMNEQARPASVAEVKARLEQVLTPKLIEPTKQAEIEPTRLAAVEPIREAKDEGRVKQAQREPVRPLFSSPMFHVDEGRVKQAQREPVTPDVQPSRGMWGGINRFFTRYRTVAWVCFIILSLLPGVWLFPARLYTFMATLPTIISAIIGLIFLLKKDRPRVDRIGGLVLVLLGSSIVIVPSYYSVFINYYDYGYDSNVGIKLFLTVLVYMLWQIVGTRLFLRRASFGGGLSLGIFLILVELVISVVLHVNENPLLLLLSIILGIVAIIVAFRKRRQSRRRV